VRAPALLPYPLRSDLPWRSRKRLSTTLKEREPVHTSDSIHVVKLTVLIDLLALQPSSRRPARSLDAR
jgi:hypothetical protein